MARHMTESMDETVMCDRSGTPTGSFRGNICSERITASKIQRKTRVSVTEKSPQTFATLKKGLISFVFER